MPPSPQFFLVTLVGIAAATYYTLHVETKLPPTFVRRVLLALIVALVSLFALFTVSEALSTGRILSFSRLSHSSRWIYETADPAFFWFIVALFESTGVLLMGGAIASLIRPIPKSDDDKRRNERR